MENRYAARGKFYDNIGSILVGRTPRGVNPCTDIQPRKKPAIRRDKAFEASAGVVIRWPRQATRSRHRAATAQGKLTAAFAQGTDARSKIQRDVGSGHAG